jgi:putative ABC transport system ATP-binding protein
MCSAVFKLSDIRRSYFVGNEWVHAINGLDLVIPDGQFLAVVGSSGSGKSTLMHILGFMDTPTAGRMEFEGVDVTEIGGGLRAQLRASRIGFVFQSFNLLPRLSVMDNVLLPLFYGRSRMSRLERKEAGMAALARVDLQHRWQHTPNQLSGGERQRVAIARALINSPRLILADEPTGNLDSRNRGKIMDLFVKLVAEGITLAVVTHDEAVAAYAHRQIRMHDGCIVEDLVA